MRRYLEQTSIRDENWTPPQLGKYKAIYLPMIYSPYLKFLWTRGKTLFKNRTTEAAFPVERIRALMTWVHIYGSALVLLITSSFSLLFIIGEIQTHLILLCFTNLAFFTNWRQDSLPVKRLWPVLLWWSEMEPVKSPGYACMCISPSSA